MKALRQSFQEQIGAVAAADLLFVDESGVNRAMTRLYARSPRGTRAFGSAPRNWGENVSILGAMSLGGPLATMCVNGATDGAVFLTYLKEMLVPRLWQGAVVVLDNLGAHKVKGVKELVEGAGARLLYLPPYSPDLNPTRDGLEQVEELSAPRRRAHHRGPGRRHRRGPDGHQRQRRPRLLRPLRLPASARHRAAPCQ